MPASNRLPVMITEASTDNHCGRKNEQACWVAGAGHACGITTQCDYRSKGHHAKSTELDGKQNDQLAEHRQYSPVSTTGMPQVDRAETAVKNDTGKLLKPS